MASNQHQPAGAQSGSFSLFPNPNLVRLPPNTVPRLHPNPQPRSRRNASRDTSQTPTQSRSATPQDQTESPQSPPRVVISTPSSQPRSVTPLQFELIQQAESSSQELPNTEWEPVHGRTTSRSSTYKPPIIQEPSSAYTHESAVAAHNQQQSYPPRVAAVAGATASRQGYYNEPAPEEQGTISAEQSSNSRSPPVRHSVSATPFSGRIGRAVTTVDPPIIPEISTSEQMRCFWKTANGWKASASEGRVYCLRMTQLKDAPVYTLSSSTQPFYNLRLDPTSASAKVTLSRHDPSKPYKAAKPDAVSSSSNSSVRSGVVSGYSKVSDSKNWQEALSTSLEEEARRYADGLVANLMPTPASKMALSKANDRAAVEMAERECAKLVWDEDTSSHYLVHPALAAPFVITVEKSPAWSRVEYTLEHHESRRHLAKLTRDGTGGGWLEVDTTVASQIESYYIIDVAVTALLLVAVADDRNSPSRGPIETFEPPPVPGAAAAYGAPGQESGRFSRLSKFSRGSSGVATAREEKSKKKTRKEKKQEKKEAKKNKSRMEEFEMDVESQNDSLRKVRNDVKELEDGLPFVLRVIVKLFKGIFKLIIWVLTLAFRVLRRCFGSKY